MTIYHIARQLHEVDDTLQNEHLDKYGDWITVKKNLKVFYSFEEAEAFYLSYVKGYSPLRTKFYIIGNDDSKVIMMR